MDQSGAGDFNELSEEEQKRYLTASRQMTKLARDHAIPITFAPPIKTFAIPLDGGRIGTVTLPRSLEIHPETRVSVQGKFAGVDCLSCAWPMCSTPKLVAPSPRIGRKSSKQQQEDPR